MISPNLGRFSQRKLSPYIDYEKLTDNLASGELEKADLETSEIISQLVGHKKWLGKGDISRLPCKHILKINELWLNHSKGKFGLSVQAELWPESRKGRYDSTTDDEIRNSIGWERSHPGDKSYIRYDSTASQGHLPADRFSEGRLVVHHFAKKFDECQK